MNYKAYGFTKAAIQFSDGREIELKHPELIKVSEPTTPVEETQVVSLSFPASITFVGYITRIRVGPFWMSPPPMDRCN